MDDDNSECSEDEDIDNSDSEVGDEEDGLLQDKDKCNAGVDDDED